ncbi:hypothetical protein BH23ACT3_BH23ACT3_05080 [soil metagenome]
MKVTLQYFDGCPNWRVAQQHLSVIARELEGVDISLQQVTTEAEAEQHRFRGSPSILVDGVDPFAGPDDAFGVSCRMYQTPDGPAGSPTLDQLRAAIAHAS